MEKNLEEKFNQAIWIAKALFQRGKATGSSANLSFRHGKEIYITASGTCFGNLTKDDFSKVAVSGDLISGKKPSKEYPLHQMLYEKEEEIGAVLHTHSFYATLWSCFYHKNTEDCIPDFTPYLKMKLGTVGLVPYGKPGSEDLFAKFKQCVSKSDGYLLMNHGPVVGGRDLLDAFYSLEELEESARIAWELQGDLCKKLPLSTIGEKR